MFSANLYAFTQQNEQLGFKVAVDIQPECLFILRVSQFLKMLNFLLYTLNALF